MQPADATADRQVRRHPVMRNHALGPRMLPARLSTTEAFALIADAGFSGVELLPVADAAERVAVREATAATGVRVSSVEAGSAGGAALLDREGDELKANIERAETAVRNAAEWGATTVLVVPGRVDADTSAEASWGRAAELGRRARVRVTALAEALAQYPPGG